MTANQIAYWNLQETKSANREVARRNAATEAETNRHNVATEGIDISKLQETVRHNTQQEGQQQRELAESVRRNVMSEVQRGQELIESARTHRANEAETRRSNVAQETESRRAHKASESEAKRSNIAREKETTRHNQSAEAVASGELTVKKSQAAEQARHNVQTELQAMRQLAEEVRHSKATESQAKRNEIIQQTYNQSMIHLKNVENQLKAESNATQLKNVTSTTERWKSELKEAKRRNDINAMLELIDKITDQEKVITSLLPKISIR